MKDKLDDVVVVKQLHVGDPRMPPMALEVLVLLQLMVLHI